MAKIRRKLAVFTAICTAGVVFQTGGFLPAGCAQFGYETALAVFDACAVLNCTSGTFFNFCSPVQVLVDCP